MMIFGIKSRVVTQAIFSIAMFVAACFQDQGPVILFCAFSSGVFFASAIEDFRRWHT